MKSKYFSFYQSSEREVVKEVSKILPHCRISVLPQALVVEAVTRLLKTLHLGDLSGLVIPSQDRHSISVSDLHANQKRHCFDGIIASVHVVAHEEVVCVWRDASYFE